jgi:hypothetical protein
LERFVDERGAASVVEIDPKLKRLLLSDSGVQEDIKTT